jgi:hypothetical protein
MICLFQWRDVNNAAAPSRLNRKIRVDFSDEMIDQWGRH